MATDALPEPPAQLKAIQSYIRIAQNIDRVDPVVAYWVRLYSTETALKIDKDSAESKAYLGALIQWLEKFKQNHKENETVTNQTVGQAHMENFVVALFNKADTVDREGAANASTVRMFYMAAVLFEAMAVFGPLTEEVSKRAKYAKFKAAYIQKCLKAGQTPKPGPIEGSDLEGAANEGPYNESVVPAAPPSSDSSSAGNASALPQVPSNEPSSDVKPDPFILTPSKPPVVPQPQEPSGYSHPNSGKAVEPTRGDTDSSSATMQASVPKGATISSTRFHATNGAPLNPEDMIKGQKFCKFATSALQYDDIPTAVANLEKALKLLTTGQRPD